MSTEIPILTITEHERIWMEEVYKRNLAAQRFNAREIWSLLHTKLPRDFRPAAMDARLITAGGERIGLLGIIALQKDYAILEQVDRVIYWIRDQFLITPLTDKILTESIAAGVSLEQSSVSLVLQIVQDFGQFLRGMNQESDSALIKDISVGGDDGIYYRYLGYPGIEALITMKSYEAYKRPVEQFSFEEMQTIDEKLDAMASEIEKLKAGQEKLNAGQEAIWTDVRGELNELKTLFSLGKKNWGLLLFGKVAEMVAGGVVSDTLSKMVEDLVKHGVSTLLPF